MQDLRAAVLDLRQRLEGRPTPPSSRLPAMLQHPLLQDTQIVTVLTAGLVLLFILLVFRPGTSSSVRTKRSGPPTVLLVGPCDGGKTSLFAKLVYGTYPQTHTSVQPSSTQFTLSSPDGPAETKQVRLIDLPGHPRLRDEAARHLGSASGVVFVVDVVGVVRTSGQVAEQLAPLLISLASHAARAGEPRRVLLLAHKTDLLVRPAPAPRPSPPHLPPSTVQTATERLRSVLTREMDRLKGARGAAGGRIEGMGRVAGGGGGWWARLFVWGSGGGAGAEAGADEQEQDEDETLLWGGKGPFRWEEVEGLEIEWGASGLGMVSVVKAGKEGIATEEAEEGDGLDAVKRFLWEC